MRFSNILLCFTVLATSSLTLAAPAPTVREVPLQKRQDALRKRGTTEIDWNKTTAHFSRLRSKYAQSSNNFLANTGIDMGPAINAVYGTIASASDALSLPSDKRKRETGNVALTDENEQLWHGEISFGGQSFQVDYDTGSADTIVNPSVYKSGASAQDSKHNFKVSYGDGTAASGEVYTDTVSVGGVSAKGAGIGRSNNQYIDPSEGDNGIAGMAFQSISSINEPPFFDALKNAKVLTKNVFTFTLSNGDSSLFLGGTGPANNPTYVNTDTSQGFWLTPDVSINGAKLGMIHDTGTTFTILPKSTARSFFRSLNLQSSTTSDGTLSATYDCNNPPKVTVNIGGFEQAFSDDSLNAGTSGGQCTLSIIGMDVNLPGGVLGDSFLRNVHAVFDRDQNRMGFSSQ